MQVCKVCVGSPHRTTKKFFLYQHVRRRLSLTVSSRFTSESITVPSPPTLAVTPLSFAWRLNRMVCACHGAPQRNCVHNRVRDGRRRQRRRGGCYSRLVRKDDDGAWHGISQEPNVVLHRQLQLDPSPRRASGGAIRPPRRAHHRHAANGRRQHGAQLRGARADYRGFLRVVAKLLRQRVFRCTSDITSLLNARLL